MSARRTAMPVCASWVTSQNETAGSSGRGAGPVGAVAQAPGASRISASNNGPGEIMVS